MADLKQYQQDYINRYAPYANLASQQIGLPARVILAKLALETGWGQHYANNNLPGLKGGNPGQNDGNPIGPPPRRRTRSTAAKTSASRTTSLATARLSRASAALSRSFRTRLMVRACWPTGPAAASLLLMQMPTKLGFRR